MYPRRFRSLWTLLHQRWVLIPLLFIFYGCSTAPNHEAGAEGESQARGRVTFVQWAAPHVFDAGASRTVKSGNGIEEERLDNWSALHWAVLQTNRLIREDEPIDFVVITGDFGLYNVVLPAAGDYNLEVCRRDKKEGPIVPIGMDEAVTLVAQEFSALLVKKVYLVPGNNDLCDENPANMYRWAEFVKKVNTALVNQRKARQASLDCAKQVGTKDLPDAIPDPPQVIDLTFTAERLDAERALSSTADRFGAFTIEKPPEEQAVPCQIKLELKPEKIPSVKGGPGAEATDRHGKKNFATQKQNQKSTGTPDTGKKPASQPASPSPQPVAPEEHGFHLLGLNSSYFKPNDEPDIDKLISQASPEEMKFVNGMMQGDGPYLLFTHVPDLEDPYRASSKADKGSSWKLPKTARESWKSILSNPNLVAVFSSHFHDSRRTIYPHNFTYAQNPPDAVIARKIWVAPPLAAKVQSHRPVEETARGMLLVRVTTKGTQPVSPQDGIVVEATPIWFSPLDQKPPLPADDKLAAAHADESDGNWDKAATDYKALLDSDKTDSATRTTALAGYVKAHRMMDSWWWRSPLARWFYLHGWALLYSAGLLLAFLVVLAILRKLRVLRLLIFTSKIIFMPKFKGQAVVNPTTKMTLDAPADEFPAQLLAAAEGIRVCLAREQEAWAAKHISFLLPSSSSFNSLLGSIPKVKEIEISDWLKFMAGLINTFRWTLETGVAVLQSDQGSPTPPAKGEPPTLPQHGELTGYAVLQWGWFVRNSWHRKAPLTGDRSAIRDLAVQLADLVAGEAFH